MSKPQGSCPAVYAQCDGVLRELDDEFWTHQCNVCGRKTREFERFLTPPPPAKPKRSRARRTLR